MEITDSEFRRLVSFMHDNYGINLAEKRVLVQGRLGNLLRERGFSSYDEYIDAVLADKSGAEVTTIINKLTTNHTFFMREPEHYTFMKETVLPQAESDRLREFRIWSAGCSSGEECYTTAMLVNEYFERSVFRPEVKILATDISHSVMDKARAGIYPEDSMKGLPKEWISRYFKDLGGGKFELCTKIKNMVQFKPFNLMERMPEEYKTRPFDLVFCRNVMIYFDQPTKLALINRFYDVVKPGGYLFIGHAESIPRNESDFRYIKPAIYRKPE